MHIDHVRYVCLVTSAYQQPSDGIRHLSATGSAVMRAATRLPATNLDFQGRVIGTGDFCATRAVELAIHHLDLGLELIMEPPVAAALDLARQTLEELAGGAFPPSISETDLILIGTGRLAPSSEATLTGLTVPAFG